MLTSTRIGGFLLLAFCLFYMWKIGDIRLLPFQANQAFTPRTMPQVLACLGAGLSLLIMILPSNDKSLNWRDLNLKLAFAFLCLMSAYGFAVRPLGFLLSTVLFLIIGFMLLGERSPIKLIAVSVPLVVLFWTLMNYGLSVFIEPLPFFLRGAT